MHTDVITTAIWGGGDVVDRPMGTLSSTARLLKRISDGSATLGVGFSFPSTADPMVAPPASVLWKSKQHLLFFLGGGGLVFYFRLFFF